MYETTPDVVDALRAKTGAASDSALARMLGVNHTAVVHWRAGRCAMSPEIAVKAAHLLGVPPELLLLRRYAELEKDPAARSVVQRLADRLQKAPRAGRRVAAIATLAAMTAAGVAAPAPSHAATPSAAHNLYILLNRRRRRPARRMLHRVTAGLAAAA